MKKKTHLFKFYKRKTFIIILSELTNPVKRYIDKYYGKRIYLN